MQKTKTKQTKKKTDVNNEYTCFSYLVLLKLNAHVYFLEFQISFRCIFIVFFYESLGVYLRWFART